MPGCLSRFSAPYLSLDSFSELFSFFLGRAEPAHVGFNFLSNLICFLGSYLGRFIRFPGALFGRFDTVYFCFFLALLIASLLAILQFLDFGGGFFLVF